MSWRCRFYRGVAVVAASASLWGSDFTPAPQRFRQEVASSFTVAQGLSTHAVQLVDLDAAGVVRVLAGGRWHQVHGGRCEVIAGLGPSQESEFRFAGPAGEAVTVAVPWREVEHLVRHGDATWIATSRQVYRVAAGQLRSLDWPESGRIHQLAVAPSGAEHVATASGLWRRDGGRWVPIEVVDGLGRVWAAREVLGVGFDSAGQLWFATKAGVGCRTAEGWRFFEGKDGLPWNDFTGIAAGTNGEVWFGTRLGLIRYCGGAWHYRQGPRWLPHDEIRQIAVDREGDPWLATPAGLGRIERRAMTLAAKADHYEQEIERYIKRTPFGYVAEAPLRVPGDRSTAQPQDSDNDGLWTAMYGAGECFAFAATRDAAAKTRARQAFEALRFLQKVTQGGSPAPPQGFVARTIRPVDGPDPNEGRLERDRQSQQDDKLWKVYEPRWPKSADGRWYWKSDTSSDELDGHYFFYPLYFEFCAEDDAERARVREVVRDLTDHLVTHRFVLMDHDGRPTRWAVYGPQYLNRDPNWWPERGLNSLSILSYLAVAAYITGEPRFAEASRELIEHHGYAQNAMYPKVQYGPGSGNQSDDEMAFMCFYSLLRYSTDERLKAQIRYSFFGYWANEMPEMNPFFNFAYAGLNLGTTVSNPWGEFPLTPWRGWHEDSMATLYGFPLDRLDWPHRNSHRLDLRFLDVQQSRDLYEPQRRHRGARREGRVLPVENRHFNHWNTDPWQLDYGGQGAELGAGTVFLLPYYMGLYHGFIEKP